LNIDDPKEPSADLKALVNRAAFIRGQIITSYAQIEFLLADFAVRCQRLPDYAQVSEKFPFSVAKRIARVREIVSMPGPLLVYRGRFEEITAELRDYEELRHFMAHGLLTVYGTGLDSNRLVYRMYQQTADGLEEGLIDTDLAQLTTAGTAIAAYAQQAVMLFREVYLRHNIQQP
jgi:hypothetical protein